MPVEDPSVEWDEAVSPFVTVATLKIPKQTFDSEPQMAYCEALSFTPWHSLPEHQPIGGINRIRKVVYERASTLRHTANGVPRTGANRLLAFRLSSGDPMQRRTFLTTGSMAAVGFGLSGCATNPKPNARGEAAAGSSRAGERGLGPDHPDDRRIAAAPRRRLRPQGGQARRQAARAQLRARRRRHVARLGHRPDGGGVRDRASGAAGGRHRLRLGRAHVRAAAAAARLRRHDLRDVGPALRDVEHVARRLHADLGPRRSAIGERRRGTRSTGAPPTFPTASCSCSPARTTASAGWTTIRWSTSCRRRRPRIRSVRASTPG